ncbi:MAG: hypothetical protein UR14_C0005G0003 [candidate division TM6 bacterium GW2011_GWE2_31_21]|nr:MAG: hypothetical protein UR14_C0005G0003 [candidate division TM6 bacterium GW2011_GWE2_31_21]KKP53079.1 MAG: hypothetical protein UR43_C0007G0003 [candidate division TM6 bacterium GW2011_GWF2_33_332]
MKNSIFSKINQFSRKKLAILSLLSFSFLSLFGGLPANLPAQIASMLQQQSINAQQINALEQIIPRLGAGLNPESRSEIISAIWDKSSESLRAQLIQSPNILGFAPQIRSFTPQSTFGQNIQSLKVGTLFQTPLNPAQTSDTLKIPVAQQSDANIKPTQKPMGLQLLVPETKKGLGILVDKKPKFESLPHAGVLNLDTKEFPPALAPQAPTHIAKEKFETRSEHLKKLDKELEVQQKAADIIAEQKPALPASTANVSAPTTAVPKTPSATRPNSGLQNPKSSIVDSSSTLIRRTLPDAKEAVQQLQQPHTGVLTLDPTDFPPAIAPQIPERVVKEKFEKRSDQLKRLEKELEAQQKAAVIIAEQPKPVLPTVTPTVPATSPAAHLIPYEDLGLASLFNENKGLNIPTSPATGLTAKPRTYLKPTNVSSNPPATINTPAITFVPVISSSSITAPGTGLNPGATPETKPGILPGNGQGLALLPKSAHQQPGIIHRYLLKTPHPKFDPSLLGWLFGDDVNYDPSLFATPQNEDLGLSWLFGDENINEKKLSTSKPKQKPKVEEPKPNDEKPKVEEPKKEEVANKENLDKQEAKGSSLKPEATVEKRPKEESIDAKPQIATQYSKPDKDDKKNDNKNLDTSSPTSNGYIPSYGDLDKKSKDKSRKEELFRPYSPFDFQDKKTEKFKPVNHPDYLDPKKSHEQPLGFLPKA